MDKRLIRVDLKGKTALVTGGAKGIGKAITNALAESGADVAINYNTSAAGAEAMVRRFRGEGLNAVAVQADVSDTEQAAELVDRAQQGLGSSIDILVNNAGALVGHSTVEEMPLELWREVFDLNLVGATLCAKGVIPGMKAKKWGRIINISSISGRTGAGPGASHYAASKAAMNSLTRTLAKELGPFGITANAVAPGVILTQIHEKHSTKESLEKLRELVPLGYLAQPDEVAGAVLFLASDSASYVTGEVIAVNGGLRMD